MTDKLPPNLLALFTPRPPLRYLPPSDYAPEHRHTSRITGVGQYLAALNEYKQQDDFKPTESWLQIHNRKKLEKKERVTKILTEGVKEYKPFEEAKKRGFGDPFKTLFVARLSYDVEPKDLEREFSRFGRIERVRLVTNSYAGENAPKKKRCRGYAFIVFERESDMKAAYKETDGIRIKDRRVLVDVERGRTVKDWRPRRFGGGLGGRGYTKGMPMRPMAPGGFGPPSGPGGPGGFRGGFGGRPPRGGFRGGYGDRRGAGYGGSRGAGIGYQNGHGSGAPPDGAPSGPRGPRRDGGGGRFEDRNGDRPRGSGSNSEPVGARHGGGYRDRDRERDGSERNGDRDRDRDRGRDRGGGYGRDDYRKRPHEGDQYDDRSKRRW